MYPGSFVGLLLEMICICKALQAVPLKHSEYTLRSFRTIHGRVVEPEAHQQ
jgi:hypothetical protein